MKKEMIKPKFYKCRVCGNIVEMIHPSGIPMMCCGQNMEEIRPQKEDGPAEKHVPVLTMGDGHAMIKVGSEPHPMTEEHCIEWIVLVTDQGIYRKNITGCKEASACFCLNKNEKICCAYAYCNIHGLWMCDCENADCPAETK